MSSKYCSKIEYSSKHNQLENIYGRCSQKCDSLSDESASYGSDKNLTVQRDSETTLMPVPSRNLVGDNLVKKRGTEEENSPMMHQHLTSKEFVHFYEGKEQDGQDVNERDSVEYNNRPHMCETCGKRFTLLENLNRHQMIHTDERPFFCNYCKKRFRLAQHLKEHIRIHTGEKPYKCTICARAFCQISNLKSHQKTHTKIKAFKCEICEKTFRRSFTLKQHKLTHTRHSCSDIATTQTSDDAMLNDHRKITRKLSAPTPKLRTNSIDNVRRNSDVELSPNKKTYRNYNMFQWESHPRKTAGFPGYIPTGPNVSSSNTTPFVDPACVLNRISQMEESPKRKRKIEDNSMKWDSTKPKYFSPPPDTSFSYFPSLSALLSQESDPNNENLPNSGPHSLLRRDVYNLPGNINHFKVIQENLSVPRSSSSVANVQNDSIVSASTPSSPQCRCMQCEMLCRDGTELRDHVIRCHNRKDQRRDSAYSSHSDKSLPSSPNGRTSSSSISSNNQHPVLARKLKEDVRQHEMESHIMKRVKELALQALNRDPNNKNGDRKKETVPEPKVVVKQEPYSGPAYYNIESQPDICPSVGQSPTEDLQRDMEIEHTEEYEENGQDSSDERKTSDQGSSGPRKWKRRLCKEWYDLPSEKDSTSENGLPDKVDKDESEDSTKDADQKEVSDEDKSNSPPNCIWPPTKLSNPAEIPSSDETKSDINENREGGSAPAYDFQRFAPIVEWKPVVTGWKDLVYGTMFALPPQMQQSYLGLPTSYEKPESAYQYRSPYKDANGIQVPPNTSQSRSGSSGVQSSGNYFRFSPQFINNYMSVGRETSVTPDAPSTSSSSGVYNGSFFPSEPLPISGYSRLQHGLLYQWDPNRVRLCGTSSVPQSANWVTAK